MSEDTRTETEDNERIVRAAVTYINPGKHTVNHTLAELSRNHVDVTKLAKYGYNNDNINTFIHFNVFPMCYIVEGDKANTMWVNSEQIRVLSETLLDNAAKIYAAVEESERRTNEYAKLLQDNAVEITHEDVELLQTKPNEVKTKYGVTD